ncbi:MAG: chemotaxis protein CheW [Chloroflexota bacterium]
MAVTERCLLVNLGGAIFGVSLRQLISVEPMARVMPIPRVPAWLLGVTYRQGRVISVVDLAAMLQLSTALDRDAKDARLLIATEGDFSAALAVPLTTEVFNVAPEQVGPIAPLPDRPVNRFLTGQVNYGEQLFGLLDLGCLMRSPEFMLTA